jgi:hypothetical protein
VLTIGVFFILCGSFMNKVYDLMHRWKYGRDR